MSVLAEYKVLLKQRFDTDPSDRENIEQELDKLWIRLSTDDIEEARQYNIQLWIDSGKAVG